jgi:hypothetical protein
MTDEQSFTDIIKSMPYGAMFYEIVGVDFQPMESVFIIKEEKVNIKELKNNPVIQIHSAMLAVNNVPVIVFMVKFGHSLLYESWLNYYQEDGINENFGYWCKQDTLKFLFFDAKNERIIKTSNSYRDTFKEYVRAIEQYPKWSMQQFDEAKQKVIDRYPDIQNFGVYLD